MKKVKNDSELIGIIGRDNTQTGKITMTPSEISVLLGVSTGTIYKMVREKEIPHFRIRSKIMFNRDIIMAWTEREISKSS